MHFERSFMYHNLMLELILRLYPIVRKKEYVAEILNKMLACTSSFCIGDRVPLFNDSGNNVAKKPSDLVKVDSELLSIEPKYIQSLPVSKFELITVRDYDLIVDVGVPTGINPAHSHSEAMSFELFYKDRPIIVNSGTYLYQTELRNYLRSANAHNTIRTISYDQSGVWSIFRVGRRAKVNNFYRRRNELDIEIYDYLGNILKRSFYL